MNLPLSGHGRGTAVGVVLLGAWAAWWLASLAHGRLLGGSSTWIPAHDVLGIDLLGPYHAARHWLGGGNPYREPFGDPLGRPHIYPPAAYWLFAWAGVVPERLAHPLWATVLTALAVAATRACLRTRQALGLADVPPALAVALVLWSTPLLFALERGNCDLVAVALILAGASALRRRTPSGDILAGVCLALAAWLKVYPGLLVVALLVLRRWRAAASFVVAAGLVAVADLPGLADWLANIRAYAGGYDIAVVPSAHSLSTYWRRLWPRELAILSAVPGPVAACLVLLPPAVGVCLRVPRGAEGDVLLVPLFLWLTALATFLPALSNDYNLVVLPLVALAVWDRGDRLTAHALLAPLLTWWQPFALPYLAPKFLFAAKLAGLAGVAVCLAARARALSGPSPPTRRSGRTSASSLWAVCFIR